MLTLKITMTTIAVFVITILIIGFVKEIIKNEIK
jgi:hypothetical protein